MRNLLTQGIRQDMLIVPMSSRISGSHQNTGNSSDVMNSLTASRVAATYFDKIERYELQETLACYSSDWLLSTDDTRISVDPPVGLISGIQISNNFNNCLVLIPHEEGIQPLELREIHQIVRELVMGIFVLNQTPSICLEANHDCSTSCQIPPAYFDTRVGQILIEVDYMMKSLWHGAYFPKEKRTKFAERWRQAVNLNNMTGLPETRRSLELVWTEAGIQDLSKDPEFTKAYESLAVENKDDPNVIEDRKNFMKNVDDLALKMTFSQKNIYQHQNVFLLDSEYNISSIVRSDKIDQNSYEKLQRRLQVHQEFIMTCLPLKVHRSLVLLKFISFMVPFLIAIKKRCKVPDITKLLPAFTFEECKTEREFPPLIMRKDFTCKNFDSSDKYFHLHGGITFDRETGPSLKMRNSIISEKENLEYIATEDYNRIVACDTIMMESYPIKPIKIDNKSYYVLNVTLETFYPSTPKHPLWIHAHYDEIAKLKPKRLPIPELQIHEQYKKRYGYQKTVKLKQIPAGLQASAIRGLVAIFHTMCRKLPPSRLTTQDSSGLSLIHHAAMFNRPQIITMLVVMGFDVNVRRYNNISSQGVSPLHLAARCGALDSLACLIAYKADVNILDNQGWAPIHYAAYYNHVDCIVHLVHKEKRLLELTSTDDTISTPVLLAGSSGALDALKCLIGLGAKYTTVTDQNNGVVHLAAFNFHTNILEYFIEWDSKDLPVWDILVDMLKSEELKRRESSIKCLEVLSIAKDTNWKAILYAGGVPALVTLLKTDNEDLQSLSCSVLCNIGGHDELRSEVSSSDATSVVVQLLGSSNPMIHSRASVVLADLACVDNNQYKVSEQGGVEALVSLLESKVEHVLVNSVNALRVLVEGNMDNQTKVANSDAVVILIDLLAAGALWALAGSKHHQQQEIASLIGVNVLVDMLMLKSEVLQYIAGMAMIALGTENIDNQHKIVAGGGVQPLVRLLRSGRTSEKVETAICIGKIVLNNNQTQKVLSEQTKFTVTDIMHLLKDADQEVRLKAGMALSTFGYNNTGQQYSIKKAGGLLLSSFEEFLTSEKEMHQAYAAFQIIVLARVIGDCDQVTLTARGVEMLVSLLLSEQDSTKVLAASLTASLGHTRAGIPDALITAGAVQSLLTSLFSDNDGVRISAAIALGYLSFNRTAERLMLVACRNTPGLFDALLSNLGGGKVAMVFIDDWKETKTVGLPSERDTIFISENPLYKSSLQINRLEINGGPPVPKKNPPGEDSHLAL
ncbi:hypothetical protein QZH41_019667 [Actinostola sp. cb2023]|nr:hypothetical protein QZH41_019667 [Actinostola sp. cb2023]